VRVSRDLGRHPADVELSHDPPACGLDEPDGISMQAHDSSRAAPVVGQGCDRDRGGDERGARQGDRPGREPPFPGSLEIDTRACVIIGRAALEDGGVQAPQRLAGLDAELLGQSPPGRVIHAQGVGSPAAPIQSEHQQAEDALSQRLLRC
jgi:hypothetical protein